ncbi:hypothetical protein EVAR_68003_1 [Eumeta japonica]|uniref:Uncharacterized protein n=1 Tax=Eumeta variegata TaxID=151549 RepID=A0A4C2A016_EUMVA|nr:hypothetical protein EVAR_68003_1 [Eumeta japonica]
MNSRQEWPPGYPQRFKYFPDCPTIHRLAGRHHREHLSLKDAAVFRETIVVTYPKLLTEGNRTYATVYSRTVRIYPNVIIVCQVTPAPFPEILIPNFLSRSMQDAYECAVKSCSGFLLFASGTAVLGKWGLILLLPDGYTILQAEVSAVNRASRWLTFYSSFGYDILIITDSQATIKSVTGMYVSISSLAQECQAHLNKRERHANVAHKRVRRHRSNCGNNIDTSRRGNYSLLWTAPFSMLEGFLFEAATYKMVTGTHEFYFEVPMSSSGLRKVLLNLTRAHRTLHLRVSR